VVAGDQGVRRKRDLTQKDLTEAGDSEYVLRMTVSPPAATTADFFARARARLTLDVPAGITDETIVPARGDHDLDPMAAAIAAVRPIRPAAVLVGVVARDEPMVLLTQRTVHLKDHAGQISFPGGKIDAADASPMAAALREADEEIGLGADRIEPIGYLDLYLTTFGFRIVPVVARVAPEFALTLNRDEVDDAFEVPLAFLMSPENHQRKSREWNGLTRHFYEMPFGERYIWGATAGILRNLYERIYTA
jgi:8-oxo-dGTP pyrophosphatase MutT (NUDIX family)